VAAIAEGDATNIVARGEFPTTTPEATLSLVRAWLDASALEQPFDALGVATFGPVDLDRSSATYGFITLSPKPGWANVDVLGALCDRSVPCGFDTDANAPAMAEFAEMKRDAAARVQRDGGFDDDDNADNFVYDADGVQVYDTDGEEEDGAAASVTNLAYVTVGTGIGVGIVCAGEPVHGMLHPEAGHIRVARLKADGFPGDEGAFAGSCMFHEDCVEGMAASAAIARRCQCGVSELACATLTLVASPQRIVLGGGVFQRRCLLTKVRAEAQRQLGGYVQHDYVNTKRGLAEFIVTSKHGNNAGIVGALTLAVRAAEREAGTGHPPMHGAMRRRLRMLKSILAHFAMGTLCAVLTVTVVDGDVGRRRDALLGGFNKVRRCWSHRVVPRAEKVYESLR